jgi:hypothetical protein
MPCSRVYTVNTAKEIPMNRIRLAVVALCLASGNAWADLRIFDVGVQHQQEVFDALRHALNPAAVGGGNPYGTVQRLPDGQILVNAQPQTLTQVEQIVNAIRARPVAAAPRVTLRYWAVLGARNQGNAADAIGSPPPPALNDVLTELKRLNGDLAFRVIGSAAVTSDSGQNGEVEGSTMNVSQVARVQGDALNADLRINVEVRVPDGDSFDIADLTIRTTLERGEYVVLAENQLQAPGLDGPVFYIVHWAAN